MTFSKHQRPHTLNGLLFVALFAFSSLYVAEMSWVSALGISSLVIAIVFGIFYSNTLRHHLPAEWTPGIHFASKRLLRLAIILYGFRVSFQEIGAIGIEGLVLDTIVVASTLYLGYQIGVRVFKLDRHLALLVSAGSAICGAAAVLAVEDVIKSEPYKTTVAVGTVVLFGTLGMFIYPMLQHANFFGFTDNQFALFAGASIHEVAQVVVAGTNVSAHAGEIGVVVKMTRVLMLVPVLILLSLWKEKSHTQPTQKTSLTIPWFAILFGVVIGFNSLHLLPLSWVALINQIDLFLLTMAMAAIGMETNLIKIKKVGVRPLYFAIGLFFWLSVSVYFLVHYLS